MANKSLDTVNEIVGISALEILEQRLPDGLRNAMGVMKEVSAYFKANPISATGAGNIKGDVENIQKLRTETEKLQKTNENLTKQDILNARVAKEKAIELKNLAAARLSDAKALDIQEKAQQRKIDADKKETDAINKKAAAELKQAEAIKAKQAAQNTPITEQSSYSGTADTLPGDQAQAGLSASQAEAAAHAEEVAAATRDYNAALKDNATSQVVDAEATIQNLTVSQQLAETLLVAKAELSGINAELKKNTAAYDLGSITEAEYVANGRQLIQQQSQLKTVIAGANQELTKQTKASLTTTGSMESLSVQLEILKTEYKRLDDQQRQSPYGLTLQKSIKTADDEIKNLSSTIGENQRKVGDYTGGITKAFTGAFSFLRQIAYIIPGLGIAGIFNLAFEAISKVATGMGALTKEQKKYKESLNSIEESSRSQANQDIARINVLTKLAADESQTYKTRIGAVKELQDTYPNTFANLKQQAILEGKLGDTVTETTKALLQRAAFQAAEKKYAAASELVYDLSVKERDAVAAAAKAQIEYNKALADGKKGKTAYAEGLDENTGLSKATVARANTQIVLKDIIKDRLIAEKEQKGYLEDAVKFSQQAGDALKFKQPKNTAAAELRKQIRDEDALRKATLDAQKRLSEAIRAGRSAMAEENAQVFKSLYEDETKSLDLRLLAYGEYQGARETQAKLAAVKELEILKSQQDQIAKIEAEPLSHRSNSDKILLAQKKAIAQEVENIEYTLAADLQKITTDGAKERLKILESYSEREIRLLQDRVKAAHDGESKITSDELIELTHRLQARKLSYKQYQEEKNKILNGNNISSLDDEISQINNVLLTETLSTEAQEKLINRKFDLIKKRREEENKQAENASLTEIERRKRESEAALLATNALYNAFKQIKQNEYDAEQKQHDIESQAVQDNLQKELDAIAVSGKSKEEQAAAEEKARADAAAAESAIDQKRKKEQVEQAKLNKQIAIAEIILKTALAVTAALPNVPLAIATGIAGTAELAVAYSTPIPSYAEGTDFHPGGKARYGEAGAEIIEKPGWNPYIVDTETISDLPRGTKVTPIDDIMNSANAEAIRRTKGAHLVAQYYSHSFDDLKGEVGQVGSKINELTKVVKNRPSFKLSITRKGMNLFSKDHNSETKYLDRNIHNG